MITYRKLKEALAQLDEEQLDFQVSTVTVVDYQDSEIDLRNVKDLVLFENFKNSFPDMEDDYDCEWNLPLLELTS